MNERIKELAEQAEQYANEQNDIFGIRFKPEYDRKFAELIIRECAEIFEGVYTDQQRSERIDTRIKQHFGVAE